MMRTRFTRSLLLATFPLSALTAPVRAQSDGAPPPRRAVIRVAHVVEPRTGKRIDNAVIVVDSGKITSVTAGGAVPAGATVIDLGNATVLPGLIDVHTHLSGESHDYYTDLFRRSPIDAAVRAHVYAKRTLEAGFTTVRDVGAPELIDVALRNAITEGVVEGPRMLVATLALSATGGHGDFNGFSPYIHFQQLSNIADLAPRDRRGREDGLRDRCRRLPARHQREAVQVSARARADALQTIQMATSNAADLLGWSEKVGTLAPGAWADMVAVRGDPLSDVTVLEKPVFVMKGGTVYRNAPALDSTTSR